jgi:acyl-CoA synthetase (AMP-forming)/AMP-acid ligase II
VISPKFKTLIEMLEFRADQTPNSVAFTFLHQPTTYAEMWEAINRFAAYLQEAGIEQGDRVMLALPNGTEFFAAFYGIQRIGGTAVPLFPGSGPDRIFTIAELCGSKIIVVQSSIPEKQLAQYKAKGRERGLKVVVVSESLDIPPIANPPEIQPDDLAFIQYTSGSTGNPKGVLLSHENLLINVVQMILGMEITPDEVFVSWLPVYHDMGLILKTMVPFYLGALVHLLPTDLRNVHAWLDTIQSCQGTFTAAPDFAYRLCLRHADWKDYDLSSLRVALNAAEPVRAQTIIDFEKAYKLEGVMVAGYGLAEATVGVSMWKPGSTPRVDARGFVSIGHPFPDARIKIMGEDRVLLNGEVGEIAIHSAANSRGYYNNPEETDRLFLEDGYLLSGDLGYLDGDGFLYIISRKKNIIKLSGSTISPGEIQEVVDALPGVRYSAAVGIDRDRLEGEQVFVFLEIWKGHKRTEDALYDFYLDVVNAIHERMGFRPGRVYLLKTKSIPMTYNGKIQHTRLKNQYLDGSLRGSGKILYPEY